MPWATSWAPHRFAKAVTMAVPHPLAFLQNTLRHPIQLKRSWYMGFFQLPGRPERAIPKDDFALILAITHIDDLKDAFPVHINIEKTDMGSQVRLS